MRVTPAKIPMPIWKNDCNRGKMKFNAAAAQCCIYAVKDKRIREMRNGMNTIEKNINVIEISDISAPELDVFARMTETQLRSKLEPEKGIFIAESPTVIRIALDAGYEPLSLLVEKKHRPVYEKNYTVFTTVVGSGDDLCSDRDGNIELFPFVLCRIGSGSCYGRCFRPTDAAGTGS